MLQAVYFVVDFGHERLHILVGRLGGDGQQAVVGIGSEAGRDAIGVALVLADVGHETAAKVSAQQGDQHTKLRKVGMVAADGDKSHAHGALQGIGTLDKEAFVRGGAGLERGARGTLQALAERLRSKAGLKPAQTFVSHLARDIDGAAGRMVVAAVEVVQQFGSDAAVVGLFGQAAAGMGVAVEGADQPPMGQKVHLLKVHLELLDVVGHHRRQLGLRIEGFLHEALEHVERLGQVLVERIEGDEGMLGTARKVEPGAVVIQPFGYLGGGIAAGAFAQHAVGEEGLQGIVLVPAASLHEDVDAHHLVVARTKHAEGHAVGPHHPLGAVQDHVLGLAYGRLMGTVGHRGACVFRNSSARARSCGVSMPMVST